MRKVFLIVLFFIGFFDFDLQAQELEEWNGATESTGILSEEEEAFEQYRYECLKRPLDINKLTEQSLVDLHLLESWQIEQFLQYRSRLGPFLTLYELQSIPGWDIPLIRKLIPYLSVYPALVMDLKEAVRREPILQSLWIRSGMQWSGSGSASGSWEGSPVSLQLRYRLKISDRIQAGFIADKDAGEMIFKGANRTGFDFYTAHLFLKGRGLIKSIALGDYVINTGQGLLQWQGPAFRRSNGVGGVKRQGNILQEYRSAGEFFFHRGAAVSIRKSYWEGVFYFSARKWSATMEYDSSARTNSVSTIQTGGYHRSRHEIINKNNLGVHSTGATVRYKRTNGQFSLNAAGYHFSEPFQLSDQPYKRFDFSGKVAFHLSMDHAFTWRNIHFFGEAGIDQKRQKGLLQGIIMALDPKLDVMVLVKSIAPGFTSFYGNAFTEGSLPENEAGWVLGADYRWSSRWTIMANAGVTRNFWLGFQDRQLQPGARMSWQVEGKPDKKTLLRIGFQRNTVGFQSRSHFSGQIRVEYPGGWKLIERWDWSRFQESGLLSQGYSMLTGLLYQPSFRPFSVGAQLLFYDTDDYNSRIYITEAGLRYQRTLFMAYGNGLRSFISLNYKRNGGVRIKNKVDVNFSLKFAQTFDLAGRNGTLIDRNTVDFNAYSLQMQAICGF